MNKEKVMGIVRHLLTFVGAAAVTYGYTDATTWLAVSGGVVAIIGFVWSVAAPEKSEAVVQTAKAQGLIS